MNLCLDGRVIAIIPSSSMLLEKAGGCLSKYTFLNLAEEVLLKAGKPMTSLQIWEASKENGLRARVASNGQTPAATLKARLIVDVRDNPKSPFIRDQSRPAQYSLKDVATSTLAVKAARLGGSNGLEDGKDELLESAAIPVKQSKYPYKEREIHPFVVSFAHYEFKGVYCKTIFHESSAKKNYTEWLHPDLVGFWFPFEDYNKELIALAGNGFSLAKFFSFELKRELTFANLRESFFQAVSNSSWAHEGYLIAANIDESDDLRGELSRLSGSFGIGVIELNLSNPELSQVLFPAKIKESIDWEGANKLAKENPDFRDFLKKARMCISNVHAHESEFDKVPSLDDLSALRNAWAAKVPS